MVIYTVRPQNVQLTVEIDAENMVRKINGIDQMSSLRTALGI